MTVCPMATSINMAGSPKPQMRFSSSVALSNMDKKPFSKAFTTHIKPFEQRIVMKKNTKQVAQVSSRSFCLDIIFRANRKTL